MSALLQKLLKAREKRVPVGRHTFIVRRPTPIEHHELSQQPSVQRAILAFVIGWEGVTEGDLIPGGDPHPITFDQSACAEWLSDRPDLFAPIAEAILAAVTEHRQAMEDSLKN